jgi:diguanylate cyclase (GGDEF)-like protein
LTDVPARYGGEEFAVVLSATNEAGARTVAARIRQAVLDLAIAHVGAEYGVVTVSAGVASISPATSAQTPQDLLNEADRALYAAKNAGRNSVVSASALLTPEMQSLYQI